MKFKVGEKVRVKKNLCNIEGFAGGYMSGMKELEGKVVTIKSLGCDSAHIEECPKGYTYDIRAFEKIEKPTKEELLSMPVGTKITTDLAENNVFVKYSDNNFRNRESLYLSGKNDINADLTINDKDCGTKIVKIEEPKYETIYDASQEVKEMTVAEIEKALGYPVKIVKEED